MRRFVVSVVAILLSVVVLTLPVRAGLDWCDRDPIVLLNGTQVQIIVSIPQAYVPAVTGPVEVDIKTPKLTSRQTIFTDVGFNGHGEEVEFADLSGTLTGESMSVRSSQILAEIQVKVPVNLSLVGRSGPVPVRVTVIPDNASPMVQEGTDNLTEVTLAVAGRL